MMTNPYLPHSATVIDIRQESTGDRAIRTFTVEFDDKKIASEFNYKPAQLCMISVFGRGESMISIASSPTNHRPLQFAIRRMGRVTNILHYLNVGEKMGVRGPFGNGFPADTWKGKNLVFIGGGIGIAPLRSVYTYVLDKKEDYGDITLIYGARSSSELAFRDEMRAIADSGRAKVELSIDSAEDSWKEFVGFVPTNVKRIAPEPENAIAITCGPPIMIKFVIKELADLGFSPRAIFTTLENKMKCGIGKCGRCNVGPIYVCTEGPVFSVDQIMKLPADL